MIDNPEKASRFLRELEETIPALGTRVGGLQKVLLETDRVIVALVAQNDELARRVSALEQQLAEHQSDHIDLVQVVDLVRHRPETSPAPVAPAPVEAVAAEPTKTPEISPAPVAPETSPKQEQ